MRNYRISIPTVETIYDDGPGAGKPKQKQRVLWAGEERPAVDAALGLEVPLSGEFPLRSISGLPGAVDTVKVEVGNELLIQQQRVPQWLGWKTLEKVAVLSEAGQ